MNAQDNVSCAFRLCFRSPGQPRSPLVFPCDHLGRVDLDDLSDRARNNYLYARAMVGRELMAPAVVAAAAATT